MKLTKFFIWPLIFSTFLMINACGGGGGGGSNPSGEVSMSITDAKPLLPEGADQATNLKVTFTEILVHKSGGGWISLPLAGDPPHTIDLLQFIDGNTTEIVPPVLLVYGKYTQIRIIVSEAWISFDSGNNWDPVVIPPGHLKTDKNFTFDPQDPSAADIIIDFDLSRSLVVTDPFGTPSYKLKPVLHIVEAVEAAMITGTIADASFAGSDAIITVLDTNGEVYTKLTVEKDESNNDVGFSIFWLVPNKNYNVEIDFDKDGGVDWNEDVIADDLPPGGDFVLNGGTSI
jgi:hypothetical protein